MYKLSILCLRQIKNSALTEREEKGKKTKSLCSLSVIEILIWSEPFLNWGKCLNCEKNWYIQYWCIQHWCIQYDSYYYCWSIKYVAHSILRSASSEENERFLKEVPAVKAFLDVMHLILKGQKEGRKESQMLMCG